MDYQYHQAWPNIISESTTGCIPQCLPNWRLLPAAATPTTIHMSRAKGVTEGGLQKEITLTATSFKYSKYKFLIIFKYTLV